MCVACLVSVSGSNQYLLRLMTDFLASQMFLFVLVFFGFSLILLNVAHFFTWCNILQVLLPMLAMFYLLPSIFFANGDRCFLQS